MCKDIPIKMILPPVAINGVPFTYTNSLRWLVTSLNRKLVSAAGGQLTKRIKPCPRRPCGCGHPGRVSGRATTVQFCSRSAPLTGLPLANCSGLESLVYTPPPLNVRKIEKPNRD